MPSATGALRKRIIASVPVGRMVIVLSRVAIGNLARRTVPGVTITGSRSGRVTFAIRSIAMTARPAGCAATITSVPSGVVIERAMVAPATCTAAPAARVSFDRGLALSRSVTTLPTGTYLGRLRARGDYGMHAGEMAQVVSTIGPIRIVRDVTAMQASRGRRVFVRDADGQVFSVQRTEGMR